MASMAAQAPKGMSCKWRTWSSPSRSTLSKKPDAAFCPQYFSTKAAYSTYT